ncbi:MAG: hypothetical protein CMC70_03730 [Flavobacteriaceae bacterium]|nr:hypothetical protein [Flavobacteriaceae bacterium]
MLQLFTRLKYSLLLACILFCLFGPIETTKAQDSKFIAIDYYRGKPITPSEKFPELKRKGSYFLRFGKKHQGEEEWIYRLKNPETGLLIGVTDFGNATFTGYAYTVMPYINFNLFGQERLMGYASMGAAWIDQKYHPKRNPLNEATTTNLNWSFFVVASFKVLDTRSVNWSLGAGYSHYSNGHSRLPNLDTTLFCWLQVCNLALLKTSPNRGRQQKDLKRNGIIIWNYAADWDTTYCHEILISSFLYFPWLFRAEKHITIP